MSNFLSLKFFLTLFNLSYFHTYVSVEYFFFFFIASFLFLFQFHFHHFVIYRTIIFPNCKKLRIFSFIFSVFIVNGYDEGISNRISKRHFYSRYKYLRNLIKFGDSSENSRCSRKFDSRKIIIDIRGRPPFRSFTIRLCPGIKLGLYTRVDRPSSVNRDLSGFVSPFVGVYD